MPRRIDETAVFESATRLFVSWGYDGTTTKTIASLAGVNEATLFRRYGGKAELICAALSAQLEGVPLATVETTDDVEADLVGIVRAYLQTQDQVGAVIPMLLVEVPQHRELRPALDKVWANLQAIAQIIVHHQARGALPQELPLLTLSALIGPLFVVGLARRARLVDRALEVEVEVERYVRAFLQGRAVPGASP